MNQSTKSNLTLTILCLIFSVSAISQITLTSPAVTIPVCSYPSDYATIPNIVLNEASTPAKASFATGNNVTIVVTAPANTSFEPGTGTVSFAAARDITSATINVTATDFTITISVSGITKLDKLTISNIRIKGTAGGTYNINRTSGTASITGDFNGNTYATFVCNGISGVRSVGPAPSDYLNITSALIDMKARGIISNTILELKADYTSASETFPLNFQNLTCTRASATLTVRPASGATNLLIESAGTSTISFNGTDYVIFDGRPGGTGGSTELIISNTVTTSTAVQLTNGSENNIFRYCILKGVNTATKGVVYFASSTAANGNSDNTIEFCEITAGATTPSNAIVSTGTLNKSNRNNIIRGNNIHDYFSAASDCSGILLAANTDSWIINANSFYETSVRTFTATGAAWSAIQLNNKVNGVGIQITGNYIGGTAPLCAGSAMTIDGKGKIQAIELNAASGTPNSVQGNVFSNMDITTINTGIQSFVQHYGGSLNLGNEAANIFGSTSQNGSVIFRMNAGISSAPASVSIVSLGMANLVPGTVNVSSNTFGGIEVNGSGASRLRLLECKASVFQYTISGNIFGSSLNNNIINYTNGAVTGIFSQSYSTSVLNISANTFQNFTTAPVVASEAVLTGIAIQPATTNTTASDLDISNNIIRNFKSNCTKANVIGCVGLYVALTKASNNIIRGNKVYTLEAITNSFTGKICGIYISTVANAPCIVSKNLIHSLSATAGNNYTIYAIAHINGTATYANNIIRLGVDTAGNNIAANHSFIGIAENAGNNNVLFNTVYIAGSNTSGNNISAAYSSGGTGTRNVLNNIFRNSRSSTSAGNYAMMVTSLTAFTSDNNDLFVNGTNGKTAYYGAIAYATLANWQSVSSKDAASTAADPSLNTPDGSSSNTNFIITSLSVCNNTGTITSPANSITDDYAGAARSATTPDMGALEMNLRNGFWIGLISTDWNNAANWEDNTIPTISTNVVITTGQNSAGGDYMPEINSMNAFAKNISLTLPVSKLTITGTGSLKLAGSITNAGTLDITDGSLELAGSATQSIAGSNFYKKKIKNLIISNNVNISSAANDTLIIGKEIAFGNVNNKTLNTGNNLTIYSDENITARVGDLTNNGANSGNAITGNVTVERFIPEHGKAWQFLSGTASGQTLKQSWMEGSAVALANPSPGYGTIMTSHLPNAIALGFDFYTPSSSSVLQYNENASSWDGITGTTLPVNDSKGYLLFVRGDRSVTAYNQDPNSTKFRTTGTLYQPNNLPPVINVQAGKLQSVANPYASAIDFFKVTRTGGVADIFYVWDPLLYGGFGYGGWQTMTSNAPAPGYTITPGGGNYENGFKPIQSGQGFLVTAPLSAGTVTMPENCKISGSETVNRSADESSSIKVNLTTVKNNRTVLLDGVLTKYHQQYSNDIDTNDAQKVTTKDESISIFTATQMLSVEKKTFENNDSVVYQLNQLRQQHYTLQIVMNNLNEPGRIAMIRDNFTNSETPLNIEGETTIPFSTTADPASYSGKRFVITFRSAAVLPIMFKYINARQKVDAGILVNWGVEHETDILRYQIESSVDGVNFEVAGNAWPAMNNGGAGEFSFTDKILNKFYRVKAVNRSGSFISSVIVPVVLSETENSIRIFPNPVIDKQMNITFLPQEKESYSIRVFDNHGAMVFETSVLVTKDDYRKLVKMPSLSKGIYQVKLCGEKGSQNTYKIIVQ